MCSVPSYVQTLHRAHIQKDKSMGIITRYADDTVLIAEDEVSFQDLVTAVKDESEKCGLLMNI